MINRQRIVVIIAALFIMVTSLSGCGGTEPSETTQPSSTETAVVTVPTTVATTTAPNVNVIAPTIAANTAATVRPETPIDPAVTMYVHLDDGFLKVRTGPGTEHAQVSALTDGMAISVIAKTDNNWYKLSDGYYVFGDYVKEEP